MKSSLKQDQKAKSPPIELIEKIVKGPYTSIQTYFKLWDSKDEKNNVLIFRADIQEKYFVTPDRFIKDIVSLSSELILSWKKNYLDHRVYYTIQLFKG